MELKYFLILLTILTTEVSLVSSWGSLALLKVPRVKPSDKLLADITRTVKGYIYIITLNDTIPLWREFKEGFPKCFSSQKQEYFNAVAIFKNTSTSAIKPLQEHLRRSHGYLVVESISFINEIATGLENFWSKVSEQVPKNNLNGALGTMNKGRPDLLNKFVALYVDIINLYQTASDQEKMIILAAHTKLTGSINKLKAGIEKYVAKIRDCIIFR